MGIGMARPELPATPFPAPMAMNKENETGVLKVCMKSSLKKQRGCAAGTEDTIPNADGADCKRKRKVRWIDANGQDLAQIKEFEQRSSSSNAHSSSAMNSNSALSWLIGAVAMVLLVHVLSIAKLL
ncbi:uncharacterized protein LOC131044128 [Cryptomeria japonica]|uniref:uncharacterized protein LOC131044128 n=1 Tax=Cryptomeria japonica TaxID=3369 RepID=UPI0027D9F987|nr:uncharacterized protein LOC131044128 [Cryptomeria japonica]